MATYSKIDARKKVAEFLDKKLQAAEAGSDLPPTVRSYQDLFKAQVKWDQSSRRFRTNVADNERILETADLSPGEVDKYLQRRSKEMRTGTEARVKYAEDIKEADDPLQFFSATEDRAKDLGLSDQQVKRFIAGEMGRRAASRMREMREQAEPKDKLSPAELAQQGFTGLAELRAMQEAKDDGQGPQGMAKGRALTTPAQRMRRAARLASRSDRREYNPQKAAFLEQQAARIDPERQSFFRSPQETQLAIEAQNQMMKNIREFEREKEK